MRNILLLATIAAVVQPLRAQQTSIVPIDPFERFIRVAGTIDEPVAALRKIWPAPIGGRRESPSLLITAAHRIYVETDERPTGRDSITHVLSARWLESVADSSSLRESVLRITQKISRSSGPPDRCTDPFGPPAYLFAPQEVSRIWSRGIRGKPTQLTWSVRSGGIYELTVRVGQFADAGGDAFPCDSRMP